MMCPGPPIFFITLLSIRSSVIHCRSPLDMARTVIQAIQQITKPTVENVFSQARAICNQDIPALRTLHTRGEGEKYLLQRTTTESECIYQLSFNILLLYMLLDNYYLLTAQLWSDRTRSMAIASTTYNLLRHDHVTYN